MRRVPAETQFAQFQAASAEKEEGGWKAIDIDYNPALCALSLHKNLQSLSSLKSFYFCVSSFTKQIAYFGVILDTTKTVAFLSL